MKYKDKIERLQERINFLESEKYGKPIYEMGFKAGFEKGLKTYPKKLGD